MRKAIEVQKTAEKSWWQIYKKDFCKAFIPTINHHQKPQGSTGSKVLIFDSSKLVDVDSERHHIGRNFQDSNIDYSEFQIKKLSNSQSMKEALDIKVVGNH